MNSGTDGWGIEERIPEVTMVGTELVMEFGGASMPEGCSGGSGGGGPGPEAVKHKGRYALLDLLFLKRLLLHEEGHSNKHSKKTSQEWSKTELCDPGFEKCTCCLVNFRGCILTCNRRKTGGQGPRWGHWGPQVHRRRVHESWWWREAWGRRAVHPGDGWRLEGQHVGQVDIFHHHRVTAVVKRTHVPSHAEAFFCRTKHTNCKINRTGAERVVTLSFPHHRSHGTASSAEGAAP